MRLKLGAWFQSDWVRINNTCECRNGCLCHATQTGNCFDCQELIRLKFGMWSPCDRESVITSLWV